MPARPAFHGGMAAKEFFMDTIKKKQVLLWVLAAVFVFGLAFAACNNGGEQQSETYDYIKDGTTYRLTITKSAARAAFVPAAGDAYVLRITTGSQTRTSSGTITNSSGSSFTLKPAQAATTFTVQMSSGKISKITGNITLDSGDVVSGPDSSGSSGGSSGTPTGFVAVEEIVGIPTGHTIGTFTLSGTVVPSNASNKTIVWTLMRAGDQSGATMSGNTITTTGEGWVDVRATIVNGLSSGRDYIEEFYIDIMRTFVAVTNINAKFAANVPAGSSVTLLADITPKTATNTNIVWKVANAGTTGAAISGSTLTTKTAGTVTVQASVAQGLTQSSPYTQDFIINVDAAFVPVTNIKGVPTSGTVPLALSGTVEPAAATNQDIVWTVKSAGTTGATIDGSTLSADTTGKVTVTATIPNGKTASTNYTQDFIITINDIGQFVPVTSVTLNNNNSYNKVGTFTLSATVTPSNATNPNIVWSVYKGSANISGNTLTVTKEGGVRLQATITNAFGNGADYSNNRFNLSFYSAANLSLTGTNWSRELDAEYDDVADDWVYPGTVVLSFTSSSAWTMTTTYVNGDPTSTITGTYGNMDGHSGKLSGGISANFYVIDNGLNLDSGDYFDKQ
jgi:hypothetical protein